MWLIKGTLSGVWCLWSQGKGREMNLGRGEGHGAHTATHSHPIDSCPLQKDKMEQVVLHWYKITLVWG